MTVLHDAPAVPAPTSEQAPPTSPRTWLRRIQTGGQIVETCPEWCTDSHRNDARGHLDDLSHGSAFDGPALSVFDATHGALPVPILAGRINVDPYSSDPRRNVPHLTLEPF
ncbi:hypothetical protein ABZ622_36040, partial [Streptomyces sp. NPDC007164]|uniref:DUF6907 domain-containing protein n=1 Tax=Streptomyces sp. NPDC007164 TaxID=3156918 RepID=UPI0033CDE03C